MNKMLLTAALAGVFAAGVASSAMAAEETKEKCYGIAEAGKNDCAASDKSHACAGKATAAKSAVDFKAVEKGTCEKSGGKLTAPAAK